MTRQLEQDGFLQGYSVRPAFARPPDIESGVPGLRYAVNADGETVLVRTWPRIEGSDVGELRPFWRDELRQLGRLAAHVGTEDYLSRVTSAGMDDIGFHMVSAIESRRLLPNALPNRSQSGHSREVRSALWRNLARAARAIDILHSHGLAHRNIGPWAILSAGGDKADFQLTGFEWSIRLLPTHDAHRDEASPSDGHFDVHAFTEDWRAFARLAGQLLHLDESRVLDLAIPTTEVAGDDFVQGEIELLRDLLTVVRLDASRFIKRIDALATHLKLASDVRQPRLYLFMPLGEENPLTLAIRRASEGSIEIADREGQRTFVENDLATEAVALAVPNSDSDEEFELMLRGRRLNYQRIRDYHSARGAASNWAIAYCAHAKPAVMAAQPLQGQVALEDLKVIVVTKGDAPSADVGAQRGVWQTVRERLRPKASLSDRDNLVAQSFLLNQIVQSLVILGNEFPVEIIDRPSDRSLASDGRYRLCIRARSDEDREDLSKVLGHRERLGTRLEQSLTEDTGFVTDTWRLIEDTDDSDNDEEPTTEWEFLRASIGRDGRTYIFTGDRAAPYLRRGLLVSADASGTHKQLRRHFKAWRALREDRSLLHTLTRPNSISSGAADPLVADEAFSSLDEAKRDVLRALVRKRPLFLVQGPPGVGKTHLVAELARQLLHHEPSSRLLFSAQSHAAVDHLLQGVRDGLSNGVRSEVLIVRCRAQDPTRPPGPFDSTTWASKIARDLRDSPLLRDSPDRLRAQIVALAGSTNTPRRSRASSSTAPSFTRRPFESLIVRSATLLFGTSNTGALERLIDERAQFDWSIVEEAAKATGNELLTSLLLAQRRVMIGDHRQLPPFNSEQLRGLFDSTATIKKLLGLADSIGNRILRNADIRGLLREFGHEDSQEASLPLQQLCKAARGHLFLFESLMGNGETDERRTYARVLTYQHRMHPAIAAVVSRAFYNDKLKSAETCELAFRTRSPPLRSVNPERLPERPILWLDMPWDQETVGRRSSEQRPGPYNMAEVRAVMQLVRKIEAMPSRTRTGQPPTLAVLTPYRAQVRALQSALENADPTFRRHLRTFASVGGTYVHTVDSFQGNEADVVIVSLVRNNHHRSLRGALGFLADERRMNVLFSRAKWRLMIVGSRRFIEHVAARQTPEPTKAATHFLQLLLKAIHDAEGQENAATVSASGPRRRRRRRVRL